MSGYPVTPPSEREGVESNGVFANPTTTPQKMLFADGLIRVDLRYRNLGSAVGAFCWVVFGAFNDADAATKLSQDATRTRLMIGDTVGLSRAFTSEAPCTRIDIVSNVASETGTSAVDVNGAVLP